ncbi:hypothetical protein ACFWXK_10625 [Streptomyces sp. NPDC059070]|uniref:hypothetical protein n=1 Tax=Streptomyces sp. NPDC059070 TaxID=3346713 RepID=UPI0036B17DAF
MPPAGTPAQEAAETTRAVEKATLDNGKLAPNVSADSTDAQSVTFELGEGEERATARVAVPQDSGRPVSVGLGEETVKFSLPAPPGLAGITQNGTTVYPSNSSANSAVQAMEDASVRALITLKNAQAPREYRFNLEVPLGTQLVKNDDGGYDITAPHDEDSSAVSLGAIDAPWAKDANGQAVPTSYRLEGTTLVQLIEITEDTVYPVVADPRVSFGRGVYIKFSRSETNAIAPYSSGAGAVAAACNKIPSRVRGVPVRTICRGTLGQASVSVHNTFKSAARQGKCVQIRLPYAPVLITIGWPEWKAVGC